jgi:hypothetical protein
MSKTITSKYFKTPNRPIRIHKSQTIANTKELVIRDYYLEPEIKQEYFVRTLYRFKPVSLRSPKNKNTNKVRNFCLPDIKVTRPFSSEVKYIKINRVDKVFIILQRLKRQLLWILEKVWTGVRKL